MSKRFRDYKELRFSLQCKALQRCQSASKDWCFKVHIWRPDPQPFGGRAAQRPGTPMAAPPTSPGRKGPEPPLRSRRRLSPPPQDTTRPPLVSLRRSPDVGPTSPTARTFRPGHPLAARPVLRPRPGLRPRSHHTGLRCARLPERALRPAARRAAGAGPEPDEGRPLLQSARGETPSKTELTCWSGGWEAGPYAL
ncbi:translation initiation factor IF-2-like [Rhinolophus ferrumequinum]|uniref:translation initiation factor IF-2-like n=1 Tax=Rhinolophus ferrumequinum TaxID=59479 RepID=UPI00140FE68D|nr:translation initiation factor IF-2-like [Rhinolophus ferrumequinum]